MRRWVVVASIGVVGVLAALAARRCGGADTPGPARAPGAAAGGAAVTRAAPVDPRTLPRVAIGGVITERAGGPIAAAQVCLDAVIAGRPTEDLREPRCGTTDAAGRYAFDDLVAAVYTVTASAHGFVPERWRGPTTSRRPWQLRLAPGERRDDVDIALARGGVAVSGVVEDINGGPIAEAWVVVGAYDAGDRGSGAVARTGEDGRFTVSAAAGEIWARASADGYADSVEVNAIAPTSGLEVLLVPEAVLAGIVVEAVTGDPVAGAEVSPDLDDQDVDGDGGAVHTDDRGRFRIARLRPGRYKPVAITVDGLGRPAESVLLGPGQTVEDVTIPLHRVHAVTGRVLVDRGAGPPTPCISGYVRLTSARRTYRASAEPDGAVRFRAVGPGDYDVDVICDDGVWWEPFPSVVVAGDDVRDRVWTVRASATITGVVRTRSGAPAARVALDVHAPGGDGQARRLFDSAVSAADGRYALRGMGPGSYLIGVSSDAFVVPAAPLPITVPPSGAATLDVVVEDSGRIAGTVVDDTGAPVVAVQIDLSPDRAQPATTDDDGRFAIGGLSPGSYHVTARRGRRLRRPGTTDRDVQGDRVTVTAGAVTTVRLVVERETGTIAGSVVDADGAPIADAYVGAVREAAGDPPGAARARWSWSRAPRLTDPQGAFALDRLAPGTYTVLAHRRGGGDAHVEHVAVGATGVRMTIRPTASIRGRASLPGGAAPSEVWILARKDAGGEARAEAFFHTGGAFAFADLRAGTYSLDARASDASGRVIVTVAEGEHRTGVTIDLRPLVTVTGRLVAFDDGAPLPGFELHIPNTDQRDSKNFTDGQGRFALTGIPAGTAWIYAWPTAGATSPFGTLRVRRAVGPGAATDVGELRMPRRRVADDDEPGDLGFTLGDLCAAPAEASSLVVAGVRPGGPAARAGLVAGDVVISVDGTDVAGANHYLGLSLLAVPAGATVSLGVARGATLSITAAPAP